MDFASLYPSYNLTGIPGSLRLALMSIVRLLIVKVGFNP